MTTTAAQPSDSSSTPAPGVSVVTGLAELALAIRARGLSSAERHAGTRAIVDWFAATIAGSPMPPARLLTDAVVDQGGDGPARLIPSGRKLSVRSAALINATASHAAELDDIYRDGIYHPGSPTVSAALALADQLGTSGPDLIRAVTVGYEIGDRIAEAVNPTHYRFWHTTGTVGTLGAAAAAADLLQLDIERMAHALATATTMAAGLQQAFRSEAMSKPLHAGHAAETGVLAALAANRGYTGALDVLEGAAGFGAAMADFPDWSQALANPGRTLGITRATVKNHSCCGHTFAAVDAALQLRAEGVRAQDISSIAVRTYTTATKVAGIPNPTTPFEARFSTAYCVAAALALGSVRLRAFEPAALADTALRELASRVAVSPDDEMESVFPRQRRARVTIVDHAGQTHTAERQTRKGDPDDPLTDSELADKFADLATPVLGEGATTYLSEALWRLTDTAHVQELAIHPVQT